MGLHLDKGLFTTVCDDCGHSTPPIEVPHDAAVSVELKRWLQQLGAQGWKLDGGDVWCAVCRKQHE